MTTRTKPVFDGMNTGKNATLNKLEDCKELAGQILQAISERQNKVQDLETKWAHYGDAENLYDKLLQIGESFGLQRNWVAREHACPRCNTRDIDRLVASDSDNDVHCDTCGNEYSL